MTYDKGLEMYFCPDISRKFAEQEQNEKNFKVANIVDTVIMQVTENIESPLYAAELGGGAHPDRYHRFFDKLLNEPRGKIDWVDISTTMLNLAQEYISNPKYESRKDVISFINSDVIEYLEGLEDNALDLVIMKYTIDHIKNLEQLFSVLQEKLKKGGFMVATIGNLTPVLKSHSTNARFLYKDEEIPQGETRILEDGDYFTVKFLKESGNPDSVCIPGAETRKYYHSGDKIKGLGEKFGFEIFLGDWKEFVEIDRQEGEEMDQAILVLEK